MGRSQSPTFNTLIQRFTADSCLHPAPNTDSFYKKVFPTWYKRCHGL
jgi:hypothetical protein